MTLIDTKKLKIERIVLDRDLTQLQNIHNCEETMRWIPSNLNNWNTIDLTNKYSRNTELYPLHLGMYKICLKIEGETKIIGELLLQPYDNDNQNIEVGYIIHKTYWKQGLGTELLLGVEEHFKDQPITLFAQLFEENKASQSLLEKLNYQLLRTDSIGQNKTKLTYYKKL